MFASPNVIWGSKNIIREESMKIKNAVTVDPT